MAGTQNSFFWFELMGRDVAPADPQGGAGSALLGSKK